jgi:acyl carrier protein
MINAAGVEGKEQMIRELATLVVEAVNLRHVPVESMNAETSFGPNGLNLDSVDILEVIITLEQRYGVKIPDAEAGKVHLRSLGALADFISTSRQK